MNKKNFFCLRLVGLILVGLVCSDMSWADELTGDLNVRLNQQIENSGINKSKFGIHVTVFNSGQMKEIYSLNAKRNMIPASLSKIVTAGAALDELGPASKFKTQLLSSALTKDGELLGDLYLKGGGDPGFVSESMWFLVNEFVRNKIQVIKGDLVVDDYLFDPVRHDPSREESRVDRAYDAPVGAMSFNWNSVNIYIRPGNKPGAPAQVFVDPENEYIRLLNEAKTGKLKSRSSISVQRLKSEKTFPGDIIRVRGIIASGSDEIVKYKNITQPALWSGYNLKAFLKRRGIKVLGNVRRGKLSSIRARELASAESKSVALMVKDMMKFSNNFVAEMLVKQIAAQKSDIPGSMETGMKKIREFIQEQGITEGLKIANPSGLTRDNLFTSESLHSLLESMRRKFNTFAENLASYPLAGVDGTLERRMNGTPAEGWIRAKTGALSGVVGLAGFAGRDDGSISTFVFIYNGSNKKAYSARQLFDRMAVELVQ